MAVAKPKNGTVDVGVNTDPNNRTQQKLLNQKHKPEAKEPNNPPESDVVSFSGSSFQLGEGKEEYSRIRSGEIMQASDSSIAVEVFNQVFKQQALLARARKKQALFD